ncbi:ATP-binding protein [Paraburkholderia sp. Se-20369]|nr:ATP-binding protein [Paraburkholderia sp. Se-20369]
MQTENNKNHDAARDDAAILHMVCGKIASGKSTLTAALASARQTILISEDVWLSRLYPGEIRSLEDYVRCAGRVRHVVAEHVLSLLHTGISVVLDFPFNTVASRAWGYALSQRAGCAHRLHYLDVSDPVCKARLRERNAQGAHPFQTSEAEFEQITRYFVAPEPAEKLNVVTYDETGIVRF